MWKYKFGLLFLLMAGVVFTGCEKQDPDPVEEPEEEATLPLAPVLTRKINTFIKDAMTDAYLWYDKLPQIDPRYEQDSKAYFDKLLYEEDKWSYITDDITAFENSIEGIEKAFGYSLAFGRFVDSRNVFTGNYFGIVEYVYPNTPASRVGFVRGDLIIKLNDGNITATNYRDLLSGTTITVTKGTLTDQGIAPAGNVVMNAEELTLDPVLMQKIIERDGYKIGYLLYLQYIADYNNKSLETALQYFKDNQITHLVLDLRYNPGGQTTAAQYLCSSIAPRNVVDANSTLVTYKWNNKYQLAINNDPKLADWKGINFSSSVPVKLNLNKIHILTGSGSASASELTIAGLQPYMDVVMVGDTTYGKYTGSITLKPENYYDSEIEYRDFINWGIQPIVFRFANSQGLTNFKNGFAPKYRVEDELLPAAPLGELTDPLLKKAVEDITGRTITAMKKASVPFRYQIVDRGFSRFDRQKRNLVLEKSSEFLNIPTE